MGWRAEVFALQTDAPSPFPRMEQGAVGLPAAVCLAGTSPHEVKLAEKVPDSLFISDKPDAELLKKHRVELIVPRRRRRTKPKTQDGRKLRRHKRRWKFERLSARLQNLVVG